MTNRSNTIAIIVAAGRGRRFGSDMPKQFCRLAGRPMLMTTIDRFAEAIGHENIVIVIDRSMEGRWLDICNVHSFESPRTVYGGNSRWESVRNAINTLGQYASDTTVMIHDGARPLISSEFIKRMAILPAGVDGMIPAVPATDSLRLLNGNGSEAVDRSRYVCVQTPQVFPLGVLRQAYSKPYDPVLTDDASTVENAGFGNITIAGGEATNIKVTNPLDMAIAETLLKTML